MAVTRLPVELVAGSPLTILINQANSDITNGGLVGVSAAKVSVRRRGDRHNLIIDKSCTFTNSSVTIAFTHTETTFLQAYSAESGIEYERFVFDIELEYTDQSDGPQFYGPFEIQVRQRITGLNRPATNPPANDMYATEQWVQENFAPIGQTPGGGIIQVQSDATLSGQGTTDSPLTVTNPFTADDETKLDGIEAGAQVNPARAGAFTADDETKLDGLANIKSIGDRLTLSGKGELSADEQSGGEQNVQSDWDITDTASDASH